MKAAKSYNLKRTESDVKIVFGLLAASLVLGLLYARVTLAPGFVPEFAGGETPVQADVTKIPFDLKAGQIYSLKTKYAFNNNEIEGAAVNGIPLELLRKSLRGLILTSYYLVPKEIIRDGKNFAEITFSGTPPKTMDSWMYNYRKRVENDIFIIFKDSDFERFSPGRAFYCIAFSVLLVFLFWKFLLRFLGIAINAGTGEIFRFYAGTLCVFSLFLLCVDTPTYFGIHSIRLTRQFFFTLLAVLFMINFIRLLFKYKTKKHWFRQFFSDLNMEELKKLKELCLGIGKYAVRGDFRGVLKYTRKGLLVTLRIFYRFSMEICFFIFVLLMGITAMALILKIKPLAEQTANAAYFALLPAIIIRIYRSLRHEKRV